MNNQKQKHINLLRAAANMLQSSLIQDEIIEEFKTEAKEALQNKNVARVDVLNEMIAHAKKNSDKFLRQYADTMQQLSANDFTNLLNSILEDAELNDNPVFEQYQNKIIAQA